MERRWEEKESEWREGGRRKIGGEKEKEMRRGEEER